MRKMRQADLQSGFTLIELMIVVVVVGILATLAYPNYVGTREGTIDREAQAALMLIRNSQRIFFSRHETFYPPGGGTVTPIGPINGNLTLDLNERQWDYAVSSVPPLVFAARAVRNGRTWSIDNINNSPMCSPTALCP